MTNWKFQTKLDPEIKISFSPPHRLPEDVVMSLRESACLAGRQETTEAISRPVGNEEIAALPPVARNDKMRLSSNPLGKR